MYSLLRHLLFRLEPELSHSIALNSLDATYRLGIGRLFGSPPPMLPKRVMGIEFPNPVGLAAGLDKNADHLRALGSLGFGFIEVGTVTPRPQSGNPKPRLFRCPEQRALVNRMGFNNKGVDHLVSRVRTAGYRGVLGINIGKNFDTPVERATEDYLLCLRKVYPFADYVVVNISSPNTPGLRDLQHGDALDELLATLKLEQRQLALQYERHVPLVVKIAPDLDAEQIAVFAAKLLEHNIDGVAATNTTLSRVGVEGTRCAEEAGGLSGRPMFDASTEVLRQLNRHLRGAIPIIGIGGIHSGRDAVRKSKAGASLVQVYTGFIYRGPRLIGEIGRALKLEDDERPAVLGPY
ncbi:dihydroorotate dehydrogenase (quinone) [Alkalilimnicola ehrlichii]|uniref:Dihydroorotate dehydrogenase (quinone) n=1 Tax=Alkalilimnicola ehrlichii TaxID=351052 RepID=A0A3E0WPI8_9GAMM|nr:quinone-dependent dihydroorotate dehydrogenase [Alkalilimnicola ehrlichii]RFA28293.1 dihydroorotate dehydrogenase (quinone) [Alkalilimnicola ehrlichii]RFA34894.1 dihydroorotate dehydrogenase (quinone) [Alkalilimnicola ehrlichii]